MVPMIALLSILMFVSISPQMVKGQCCISAMQVSFIVCKDVCILSCLTLCNPMDCGPPGPLSMGISKQEYWSGLPFLPPGDLPDPEIKLMSPALQCLLYWQVDSLLLSHWGNLCVCVCVCVCVYIYICTCICMYVCMLSRFSHIRLCVTP